MLPTPEAAPGHAISDSSGQALMWSLLADYGPDMTPLPDDLRTLDGHPLASLAARVHADLAKIGIPMYLDHGDGRDAHPHGMGASVSDVHVILCWDRPEQKRVEVGSSNPYDEDELAVIQHAAHGLTAAVVSALTGFGHSVSVEHWSNPFAPLVLISP